MSKARNICFTLNNWKPEEYENLKIIYKKFINIIFNIKKIINK
jgi:hypothetical protein